MYVWIAVIVPSAVIGMLCALYIKQSWAKVAAGAIPWFALLIAILLTEYVTEYQGGGATMWLIAQFFGGTVAAVTGVAAFNWTAKKFADRV